MRIDGLDLISGSTATNFTIASGTSFPTDTNNTGELFYLTSGDTPGMYIYDGSVWEPVTTGVVDFNSLNVKQAVRAATTSNITLSGTQTIDGVAVTAGDRVLVKNQSTGAQNGIYVVAAGAWTRATDFDGNPVAEVEAGDFVFVTEGTVQAETGWVLTNNGTIVVGTTALAFAQFTGGTAVAANILTGTALASNIVTSSLTSLGTLSSLAVTGTTTQTGVFNHAGASSPIQLQGSAGTSGQVLTSAGAGATPTWQVPSGFSGGTITSPVFITSGETQLTLGASGEAARIDGAFGTTSLTLFAGNAPSATTPPSLILTGGTSPNTLSQASVRPGGNVQITGGRGSGISSGTGGTGGSVLISGGPNISDGLSGDIRFLTFAAGEFGNAGVQVERFRILGGGAWSVGTGGTATGTTGQVLTSTGATTPPTWQTFSGFSGGAITSALTISVAAAPQLTLGTNGGTAQITTVANTTAGQGQLIIKPAATVQQTVAAALTLQGGDAGNYGSNQPTGPGSIGGTVIISGGRGAESSGFLGAVGGAVDIRGGPSGLAFGGNAGGPIIFSTFTNATTLVERFRILSSGAWSVGTGGTATGTTGQVLTSTGATTPPTWQPASGGSLTNLHIGYGSGTNTLTGSSNFTFNGTDRVQLGVQNATAHIQSKDGSGSINAGNLVLQGGSGGNPSLPGNVTIVAGSSFSTVTGGNIFISGGVANGSGTGGYFVVSTAPTSTLVERVRILNNGAWSVGTGGTATGTSGQVLTSTGATTPPTWQQLQQPRTIIPLAASDETSSLTTGLRMTFRMPAAMTLTAIRASVTTAPAGSALNVVVRQNGTAILSAGITITAGQRSSVTSTPQPVITTAALVDDAEITIEISSIGSTTAGAGLKVYLIGN